MCYSIRNCFFKYCLTEIIEKMKINLPDLELSVIAYGEVLFSQITNLPLSERLDDKKRTGIQVLIREIGTKDNLLFVSVFQPSQRAMFFACEKAARSDAHGDYSSANSADPDNFQYPGSITVEIDGQKFQASVSGLKSEEDVYIASQMLAFVLNKKVKHILLRIVQCEGRLPNEFFTHGHYLFNLLQQSA